MRILHLDPDDIDSPASGGGPVRTFEIYRRLAKRHEITVLTPNFEGAKPVEYRENIKYVRVGRRYGKHNSTYYFSYFFSVPFAARRYACDLLVEDLMPPTAATITPFLRKGRPLVGSVQWFFAKEWAKQFKIPFHWYQVFGLRFYSHLIALTDDMKETLLRYNPRADVQVIANGLNDDLFKLNDTSRETGGSDAAPKGYILYLGRLDCAQKGVDLLIEAFAKISGRTDARLVIAGDGTDAEKIKDAVRRGGLSERVDFVGKVGMERKKELLAGCLFVCLPSRYETFCMVALEAFASAKTVVAFDIPFMEIVKPDLAVRVPAFDADRYADAMLDCLNRPDRTRSLGQAARQHALRYTWDQLALEQEAFYERALTAQTR